MSGEPQLAARLASGLSTLLVVAIIGACAPASSGATPVQVTIEDDRIEADPGEVPSGRIEFRILNQGSMVHEMEVFAGATAGESLEVRNSVADTTGLTLVDEIEDILIGSALSLTVDLAPGAYLLLCNLPEHYANGMWTYVTVVAAASGESLP